MCREFAFACQPNSSQIFLVVLGLCLIVCLGFVFNIKTLWLVRKSVEKIYFNSCGGVGPLESHLLTCSKFFFKEKNK